MLQSKEITVKENEVFFFLFHVYMFSENEP